MAMINRISRLFKADFNSILDQIEEPEQLLKQAIRDMEDDLTETERRIKGKYHDQQTLAARSHELEKALAEIEEQLGFCFESGKDDLARNLVRKKLEASQLAKRLAARQASNAKYLETQQAALSEKQSTLESLQQKAELFAQRSPARSGDSTKQDDLAWSARAMTIGDEEVEIAFLREKSVRQRASDKTAGTKPGANPGRSS